MKTKTIRKNCQNRTLATKSIPLFLLLMLLLNAAAGAAFASQSVPDASSPSESPNLDDPVRKWTDTHLERLVEMAINEEISVSEIEVITDQMTEKQIMRIGDLLAIRADVWDEWRQTIDESKESLEESQGETTCQATLSGGYAWGCYPLEYRFNPLPIVDVDYYYSSVECNGGDEDWVFYDLINYAGNPDGLRWYTTSSRVYLAFLPFGLNLNSFSYNFYSAHVVIGKTRVSLAGGPDWVRDHLFLKGGY